MKAANLELLHGYRKKELPLRRKQTHRQTEWLCLCCLYPLHARGRTSGSRTVYWSGGWSLGASSCDHPVPENPVGFNHLTLDPNSCLNCPSVASFSTYLMISFALKSFLYKNHSVAEHSTTSLCLWDHPQQIIFSCRCCFQQTTLKRETEFPKFGILILMNSCNSSHQFK